MSLTTIRFKARGRSLDWTTLLCMCCWNHVNIIEINHKFQPKPYYEENKEHFGKGFIYFFFLTSSWKSKNPPGSGVCYTEEKISRSSEEIPLNLKYFRNISEEMWFCFKHHSEEVGDCEYTELTHFASPICFIFSICGCNIIHCTATLNSSWVIG